MTRIPTARQRKTDSEAGRQMKRAFTLSLITQYRNKHGTGKDLAA